MILVEFVKSLIINVFVQNMESLQGLVDFVVSSIFYKL